MILYSIMAGGAALLAYLLYVVISNNIVITALVVCSVTFFIHLRRLCVSQSQADRGRASQPRNLKPIRLTLSISKKSGQVVNATCDKNFVDVLLSCLVLPLGKVIRLADKKSGIGSMDELYKSVEALSTECFWTTACKNMLLKPRSAYGLKCSNLAVKIDQTDYNEYYTCPKTPCLTSSLGFVSLVENSICGCGRPMDKKLQLICPERNADSARGFVAGVDKFIVSDDLHVAPVTSTRTRSLARREGIRDEKEVFDKDVDIGLEEVLQLLHYSILSKRPLTYFFQPDATITNINQLHDSQRTAYQYSVGDDFVPRGMYVNLLYSESMKKVVCLEAQEDFVDFLFSFLTLPLGSIVRLLPRKSSLRSMDNLYYSVTVLQRGGTLSVQNTLMLQNPKLELMFRCENQLLEVDEDVTASQTVRTNRSSLRIVNPKIPEPSPIRRGGGFVRQQGCFLVTDGLLVRPLLPALVPLSDVKQIAITVGKVEALALLEAALTSKTVLTRAFWPYVVNRNRVYYR